MAWGKKTGIPHWGATVSDLAEVREQDQEGIFTRTLRPDLVKKANIA